MTRVTTPEVPDSPNGGGAHSESRDDRAAKFAQAPTAYPRNAWS